jgi:predicted esterase
MNNRIVKLLFGFLLFFSLSVKAQQTPQTFVQETHYLLSLPVGYDTDTTKRWPLVLFLHGSGESGFDLEKVKVHGPPKLVEQGKKFPFILISPQAPPQTGWQPETLYALLQQLKKTMRVDPKKIYLTGLSMGGFGTWNLASKYPAEFAAIAPVCGGGDSADAWKLRHIPIWCFHGAKDDVVSPAESQKMVMAARRYNPAVRFTLYPEANHNSWDLTYDNDSLYQWLLAQTKFRYSEVPVTAETLKKYTGRYFSPAGDTVTFSLENNTLLANPGRGNIPLKPAGNNLFFVDADQPVDLEFMLSKGAVTSFILRTDKWEVFRKIPTAVKR